MAVYQTYQTVGIREDLADIIYSISPTETPFMSGVAKTKADEAARLRRDKLSRLKKSGQIKDAAKIFKDFL